MIQQEPKPTWPSNHQTSYLKITSLSSLCTFRRRGASCRLFFAWCTKLSASQFIFPPPPSRPIFNMPYPFISLYSHLYFLVRASDPVPSFLTSIQRSLPYPRQNLLWRDPSTEVQASLYCCYLQLPELILWNRNAPLKLNNSGMTIGRPRTCTSAALLVPWFTPGILNMVQLRHAHRKALPTRVYIDFFFDKEVKSRCKVIVQTNIPRKHLYRDYYRYQRLSIIPRA